MTAKTFYVPTAIAYVNGAPHLGHAMEMIQADCLARYYRLQGQETYYLTGTDEHGSKIYEKAQELGLETQELVDQNAAKFVNLTDTLNITNDGFIRTSSKMHHEAVKAIWAKLEAAGDIYKDSYEGLYCVGCEAYITKSDLTEDGLCPNHQKEPERITEENYFFRLSKYSEQIAELIRSGELRIIPESRKKEILNLIEAGLTDVSFSRPKTSLPWGVQVPNDPEHVMYVWCDALSNYITGLGYASSDDALFKKFWPANIQIIGKDILRFHAAIWIGILLSAGEQPPKAIGVHGFITSDGHKMSKSLGNVVDPFQLVEKFGSDAVRYYLLKEIPTTGDGDFTYQRFIDTYNADLANNFGNLVSRASAMINKYNEGRTVEVSLPAELNADIEELTTAYDQYITDFDLKKAAENAIKIANLANKYLETEQPWQVAKTEPDVAIQVLSNTIEMIRITNNLLKPYIPTATEKISAALGDPKTTLAAGSIIQKTTALFPRLEAES